MTSEGDRNKTFNDGGQGKFPDTRWSLVVRAGGSESPVSQEAIADLCQLYYNPIYVFALRTGSKPQDAMDLTQGFFEFFLRTGAYTAANPNRGKLRSFLLASFKNFARTERRKQQAVKRGGREEILSLDAGEDTAPEPPDPQGESPDLAFDRAWAKTMVELVTKKLQKEYEVLGREQIFLELREFVTGQQDTRTYAEAAEALDMNAGAARVTVHRMRQRFKDLFRNEVAETLDDPSQIDVELAYLKQALFA